MRKTASHIIDIIKYKVPAGMVVPEHTNNEHWYRYVPKDVKLPSVTTVTSILQAPHLKRWAATVAVDYIEERISMIKDGDIIPLNLRNGAVLAHQSLFEDAGDIGTQGHAVIERYLKNWIETGIKPTDITRFIEDGEDYRIHAITRSAQMFFDRYRPIPVASEMKIAYIPKAKPTMGFGGTLDALMMLAFPVEKGNSKCEHLIAGGKSWDKEYCTECGATWQYEFTLVDFKTSNSIWKDEYLMQTAAYWKAIQQMTGLKPKRIVIVRLDKMQAKYELLEVLNPSVAYNAFRHLREAYDFFKKPEELKSLALEGKEIVSIDDL